MAKADLCSFFSETETSKDLSDLGEGVRYRIVGPRPLKSKTNQVYSKGGLCTDNINHYTLN